MQDASYWIFLGLLLVFMILYVVWHKRNMILLTEREKRKQSLVADRAFKRELQYIWIFVGITLGLFLSVALFDVHHGFYGMLMVGTLLYAVLRNFWIYRRINLPGKFIKSEFYLGSAGCLLVAILTFWNFWQK